MEFLSVPATLQCNSISGRARRQSSNANSFAMKERTGSIAPQTVETAERVIPKKAPVPVMHTVDDRTAGALDMYYALLLLGPVVAIGLGYAAFTLLKQSENSSYELRKAGDEQAIMVNIERTMFLTLKDCMSVTALMSTLEPTDDQFQAFMRSLSLNITGYYHALQWIPVVTSTERPAYEAAMRAKYPQFRFTQERSDGVMVTRVQSAVYYPVYYIYPYEGNDFALGYDLGSSPKRRYALELAGKTGEFVASEKVSLLHGLGYGMLLLTPVYYMRGNQTGDFMGCVIAVLSISEMIKYSTGDFLQDVNLYVYDKTEGYSLIHSDTATPFTYQAACASPCHSLQIGGRTWLISIQFTKAYHDTYQTSNPTIVGFLIAFMFAILYSITVYVQLNAKTRGMYSDASLKLARTCAEAISLLELDSVMWLQDLPPESDPLLLSLGTMVVMLVEYKRFLPTDVISEGSQEEDGGDDSEQQRLLSLQEPAYVITTSPASETSSKSSNPSPMAAVAKKPAEDELKTTSGTVMILSRPLEVGIQEFASAAFSDLYKIARIIECTSVTFSLFFYKKVTPSEIYTAWSLLLRRGIRAPTAVVTGTVEAGVSGSQLKQFVVMGPMVQKASVMCMFAAKHDFEFVCNHRFKEKLASGAVALCVAGGKVEDRIYEVWGIPSEMVTTAIEPIVEVCRHIEKTDQAAAAQAIAQLPFATHDTAVCKFANYAIEHHRLAFILKLDYIRKEPDPPSDDRCVSTLEFADRVMIGEMPLHHQMSFTARPRSWYQAERRATRKDTIISKGTTLSDKSSALRTASSCASLSSHNRRCSTLH